MTVSFAAKCRRAYWQGIEPHKIAWALQVPISRVEQALFVRVAAQPLRASA